MVLGQEASSSIKRFALATLVAFTSAFILPSVASSQAPAGSQPDPSVYDKFQDVIKLRNDGNFEAAIAELREIIKHYSNSEKVLREAFNHLVTIYIEKDDVGGAMQAGREALERFPKLEADVFFFPPTVNEYYNTLRKEMFGSLTINKPKGCRVLLDGKDQGGTPLQLDYVPVGDHDLTLSKSGYHDYTGRIHINPGRDLEKEPPLDKKRGWTWWTYRVGAGVVAVALLAVGLSGGDEPAPAATEAPELPGPPKPPTN